MSATAADIRVAIQRQWPAPEYAVLFEVGDATGGRAARWADAIVMGLWPSRGLMLHGMEIKVFRSDWLRERQKPEKAENIAARCENWSLVTCGGVVNSPDEIPPGWGWYEFDGKRLVMHKAPPLKADVAPIDRSFLAALLRRAAKTDDAMLNAEVAKRMADAEREFDERVKRAVDRRVGEEAELASVVKQFEEASGIKLTEWCCGRGYESPADIGRAVMAIIKSGVNSTWNGLQCQSRSLREAADKIDAGLAEMGLLRPEDQKPARQKRKASA